MLVKELLEQLNKLSDEARDLPIRLVVEFNGTQYDDALDSIAVSTHYLCGQPHGVPTKIMLIGSTFDREIGSCG
jgi:hypothetical protein